MTLTNVWYILNLQLIRAFDVEMLFIAEKLNMSLAEVAVNWTEIEGNFIWVQLENYLIH